MSISGIQGLPLEVTVAGCYNLEDKEWLSRQDPYIFLEYGSNKFTTKTCTDGGRNPTFQERFIFTLIEGLQELNVGVWNSRTIKADEFIGSGKIQLHKALSQGFDDSVWPLQSKTGRHAGEIRLILHFSSAKCNGAPQQWQTKFAPSAPQYATPSGALIQLIPQNSAQHAPYPPPTGYNAQTPYTGYPPTPSAYPPTPPVGYPPQTTPPAAAYPQETYPPAATYPQQTYPPAAYPPQRYPPAPHAPNYSPYPPAGHPSGSYPPPPYY